MCAWPLAGPGDAVLEFYHVAVICSLPLCPLPSPLLGSQESEVPGVRDPHLLPTHLSKVLG
jgi:hypothetical protein